MNELEQQATELQQTQDLLSARTAEMSALERAASVFGATTRPDRNIYRHLTEEAANLLNAEICAILLYDAEQEELVAQESAVGVDAAALQDYRIPLDEASPARPGWDSGEHMVIHDAQNHPLIHKLGLNDLAQHLSVHSLLTVGLRHEGKLLGALQLANKRDGSAFTADDVRLITIFASQVAVAIENAQLLGQAQRHAEEMASLYAIASALAEAADLDETLNSVLAEVRRVVEYDGCFITLATADSQALYVRATDGEGAATLLGIELPLDQGINAWIYRQGSPTLVGDADADSRRVHIDGRTEAIRAAVGAPLITDGQPIGTLYAFRHHPHDFEQADLNFLNLTATQVAAAVQRARLLDQATRRAKEMESISKIGAVMAASLDVDHILQAIYEQASEILDAPAFFIALCDPDGQQLHFRLMYDQGERLAPFSRSLAQKQGLTLHVVRTAEPLLIRDVELEREALSISPEVLGEPSRSWLGVPIIAKDQVLGVISAQSYTPYAFTTRQLRLLTAVANQAGISLQNARLYAAIQQAHQATAEERDKLDRLHHAVLEVQRTDNLRDKLQIIAAGIHQVGWGRVSVSTRNAQLDVKELVCVGFTPEDEAALRENLLPGKAWQQRFGRDLERYRIGQCYYLPWSDPWVREQVRGVESHQPVKAADTWHPQDLLYVPLCGRDGQIMGIIGLDDPQDGRRPTEDSLHIIELFAQETGLALQNAQLLDDLLLLNTDLQEMLDAQVQLLRTVEELASPVVPIVDGVIVLPLVGHVDERRAGQILETLLGGIEEHRAKVVILDITGVPVIDIQVANHLMQTVRAARLLGAEAILVGIRPDVAQTLVTLGVNLRQVVTRSDLQSGFQYALTVISQRLIARDGGEGPRP